MRSVNPGSPALVLVILLAAAGGLSSASAPAPARTPAAERRDTAVASVPSGRVWIGREHEFEDFIRTAPVVRVRRAGSPVDADSECSARLAGDRNLLGW